MPSSYGNEPSRRGRHAHGASGNGAGQPQRQRPAGSGQHVQGGAGFASDRSVPNKRTQRPSGQVRPQSRQMPPATGSNNPRVRAQAAGRQSAAPRQNRGAGYAGTPTQAQRVAPGSMPPRRGPGSPQLMGPGAFPSSQLGPAPKKKRMSRGKKIALGVLSAVLLVLVGVGTAVGLYYNGLKDNMKYDGDVNQLKGALSEANYEEPFYVLVIGSDHWENYGARSDAMILARIDLNIPQITMVSVPRDTPYEINGQRVKLNEAFSRDGEVACIEAVSALTGVEISHYVELEFDQLQGVVESLGGIEVDVPYTFDYQVYTQDEPVVHVDAGKQRLTGEQAVAFARMRTVYNNQNIEQDAIRQANIRAMMVGAMKQVLSKPVNEIPGQIQMLSAMIKTDISLDQMVDWAIKLAQAQDVKLYSCTGPTQGSIDDETGLWLTYEAPEQWAKLMDVVDSGGDPTHTLNEGQTSDGKVQLESTETIS